LTDENLDEFVDEHNKEQMAVTAEFTIEFKDTVEIMKLQREVTQ
jgi:hypothetical protein